MCLIWSMGKCRKPFSFRKS
uniref:Uncharacterized protein n=1 Tax=Anguilla anguilla TaxID=7936 RepID=A0A0E9STU1_ANGAN